MQDGKMMQNASKTNTHAFRETDRNTATNTHTSWLRRLVLSNRVRLMKSGTLEGNGGELLGDRDTVLVLGDSVGGALSAARVNSLL